MEKGADSEEQEAKGLASTRSTAWRCSSGGPAFAKCCSCSMYSPGSRCEAAMTIYASPSSYSASAALQSQGNQNLQGRHSFEQFLEPQCEAAMTMHVSPSSYSCSAALQYKRMRKPMQAPNYLLCC